LQIILIVKASRTPTDILLWWLICIFV